MYFEKANLLFVYSCGKWYLVRNRILWTWATIWLAQVVIPKYVSLLYCPPFPFPLQKRIGDLDFWFSLFGAYIFYAIDNLMQKDDADLNFDFVYPGSISTRGNEILHYLMLIALLGVSFLLQARFLFSTSSIANSRRRRKDQL